MNIKTQVTVVALVLLAMVLLINRIRKNKLELKYSFMWFVIIFALVPELTAWLAGCMGIGQPINFLFFAGFCFSLLIIYVLTMAISRLSVKMKRLTQEMGLLKKELEEMKKKNEEQNQ